MNDSQPGVKYAEFNQEARFQPQFEDMTEIDGYQPNYLIL
jgi:hypothetical protein